MGIDLSVVWHALESVLSFAIIGVIGYYLASKKWFSAESNAMLTKLVTLVALPLYLLYNINSSLTKDEVVGLAYGLAVPYISIFINLAISVLLVRLLKIPSNRRGIFCVSASYSNTIYIGLPVNMALFGPVALPYVLLYYFGNSSLFWTIGNYMLAGDGEGGTENRIWSMSSLKRIFSLPMIGFLIGLTLLMLDLKLPTVLADTARSLGSITTPLVLITIGVTLYDMGLDKIRPNRDLILVLLVRFVVSAVVVVALTAVIPLPSLMRKVFIIQATLPSMSTIAMLSGYYKSDVDYATVTVSASTILALITIPVYMVIVSALP